MDCGHEPHDKQRCCTLNREDICPCCLLKADNVRIRSGLADIGKLESCTEEVWKAICALSNTQGRP
jgi:hypothetical protein